MIFLVLYADDILIIINDIPALHTMKIWLEKYFEMKDLEEVTYILGVRIYRYRSKKLIALSQRTYIEKVLKRFNLNKSKKGFLPVRHDLVFSKG